MSALEQATWEATGRALTSEEIVKAARIARRFHETYEELAPVFGYKTREESAVPWEDVPDRNKRLMVATVRKLIATGEFF